MSDQVEIVIRKLNLKELHEITYVILDFRRPDDDYRGWARDYSDHPDYRPEWAPLLAGAYVDNFDRSDGTLGANWTPYSSTLAIVANANRVDGKARVTRPLTQVTLQLGDAIFDLPPHVRVRAGDVVSWNRDRENRPVGDGKNVRVLVTRDDETVYEGPAVRRDSHPDYREEWRD